MWRTLVRSCPLVVALMSGAAVPAQDRLVLTTLEPTQACGFFRNQAYGKGLAHFATEMLWACETIAARRGAGLPLSERLEAAEAALLRYRDGILAGDRDAVSSHRPVFGLGDARKRELAEATGVLAALSAIETGF
jgi:hypothetical protein